MNGVPQRERLGNYHRHKIQETSAVHPLVIPHGPEEPR